MLKNPKDFWSGVMFAAIGFAFAIIVKVYDYPMGTTSRMGAGYFPFVLGNVMGVLGLIIIGQSLFSKGGPISKFAWRPLFWVLLAFVIFGLTAKLLGLVIAILILVVVASYGGHEHRWKEAIISSIALAACSIAVFVYGLKLPFPIWPSFITG
ncbi:MAG: tripartite tricarboxylate transporter TctB family protein [Usitatibacteraceae bacterium]